jgi:mRNA interferase RelE/StbE
MTTHDSYALDFHPDAYKDWISIDNSVRIILEKKLMRRLLQPYVPADRLAADLSRFYRIKNSASGHRLIYEVLEEVRVVFVVAVNKREDSAAYDDARKRS